jgi:trk system potassium uptake protein
MSVMILGCGCVGSGVARGLVSRDVEVTVVDHDAGALALLGEGFHGSKVLGSILDRRVLTKASVDRAAAVAAVTGGDEVNAVVALAARRLLQVPTVVARLDDRQIAIVHQRLGIRTLAPATWGSNASRTSSPRRRSPRHDARAGHVEMVDVHVPPLVDGRHVRELEGEIEVVALTRHGRTTLPTSVTRLHAGDVAHVAVGSASLGRLETLLGHREEARP